MAAQTGDDESDSGDVSDEETEHIAETIQDLVADYKMGNLETANCEWWQRDLIRFWIRTEGDFQSQILGKLFVFANAHLKENG